MIQVFHPSILTINLNSINFRSWTFNVTNAFDSVAKPIALCIFSREKHSCRENEVLSCTVVVRKTSGYFSRDFELLYVHGKPVVDSISSQHRKERHEFIWLSFKIPLEFTSWETLLARSFVSFLDFPQREMKLFNRVSGAWFAGSFDWLLSR